MELRQLRYFVAVAEDSNFSRAATRLYISQPALSRQIKNLEDELGSTLFLRQADGLKLTEAGYFFLEQAKEILKQSQTTIEILQSRYKQVEQPLRIGYIPSTLKSILGDALNRFGPVYPQIPLRLKEMCPTEQVKALREGTIDIAFIGNAPSELEAEFEVQCVKCVPVNAVLQETHQFADRASIQLNELSKDKFVGVSEETFPKRNEYIRDVCRRAGFTPDISISADTLGSMLALVAAGQGVALIPSEAASLPHTQVVFVPLSPPCFARSTAMWRKEPLNPSLKHFLKVLLEVKKVRNS